MWVLKAKGQTFYVASVRCNKPWETKETPDHPSTKGAIRIRNCSLTIDAQNVAILEDLAPP